MAGSGYKHTARALTSATSASTEILDLEDHGWTQFWRICTQFIYDMNYRGISCIRQHEKP